MESQILLFKHFDDSVQLINFRVFRGLAHFLNHGWLMSNRTNRVAGTVSTLSNQLETLYLFYAVGQLV